MGAGYCQWGGLTDRNIYNIYGGYRVMLRMWDFYQFWHLASHTGSLPILGNPSRGGLLSFSNFWQVAKIGWHAANSTPPDPPWPWIVPHTAPVTNIEKRHIFMDIWPWPLTHDLNLSKRVELASRSIHTPKIKPLGPLVAAGGSVTHGRKES